MSNVTCSNPISPAEARAIAYTPKFTAALSIVGAAIIIFRFLMLARVKRNVYQRLIFGMSVMNFFGSIGFFLGQWTFPDNLWDPPPASCVFQGWLLQINSAVYWYNGVLATNFLLRIKYEWSELDMLRVEPYFHLTAWLYPTVTSFIALGMGMYGMAGPWCWITSSYDWARYAFFFAELWAIMIYSFTIMWVIVRTVVVAKRRSALYQNQSSGKRMTREVSLQAILYCFAFFMTWIFGTANRIQGSVDPNCPVFALQWLHSFFVPLQGFFNCLVYIFPRFVRWNNDRKELQAKRRANNEPIHGCCDDACGVTNSQDCLECCLGPLCLLFGRDSERTKSHSNKFQTANSEGGDRIPVKTSDAKHQQTQSGNLDTAAMSPVPASNGNMPSTSKAESLALT